MVQHIQKPVVYRWLGLDNRARSLRGAMEHFVDMWSLLLYNENYVKQEAAVKAQVNGMYLRWNTGLPLTGQFLANSTFSYPSGNEMKFTDDTHGSQWSGMATIKELGHTGDDLTSVLVGFDAVTSIDILRRGLLSHPFTITPENDTATHKGYARLLNTIQYYLQPSNNKRTVIFKQLLGYEQGQAEFDRVEVPPEILLSPALPNFQPNNRQLIAASAVHRADLNPLVSIQAPFGTGKTALGALLVRSIVLASPEHTVLVVANTNRAADNIALLLHEIALVEKQPVLQPLRVYSKAREQGTQPNLCDSFALHHLVNQLDGAPTEILRAATQLQQYKDFLQNFQFDTSWSPRRQADFELEVAWKIRQIRELTNSIETWVLK